MNSISQFSNTTPYFGISEEVSTATADTITNTLQRMNGIYHCCFCSQSNKTNSSAWKHIRDKHQYRALTAIEKRSFRIAIQRLSQQFTTPASPPTTNDFDIFMQNLPPFFKNTNSSEKTQPTRRRRHINKRRKKNLMQRLRDQRILSKETRQQRLERDMKKFLKRIEKDFPHETDIAERIQQLLCKLSKTNGDIPQISN
jgi:hypothetical protein